jgi:hypothetical protein
MLVSKRIEEEAQENTRFIVLLSKDSRSASFKQNLKTRLQVLDFVLHIITRYHRSRLKRSDSRLPLTE